MSSPDGLRALIRSAATELADAGIDSARSDAERLAAHAAGTEPGRLALIREPGGDFRGRYRRLVSARRERIPLQHLIGTTAFGPVTLRVGPGVFTPRPETEAMLEWACGADVARELPAEPVIVDACTGSGALAIALAHGYPKARVIGVDDSEAALSYARDNRGDRAVRLIHGDVADPSLLAELAGRVDLLVSNPPYIPEGARLDPEVAQHDPAHALFGGPDGMTVIEAVVEAAIRLLRPRGMFAVEHDDTTSDLTVAAVGRSGVFDQVSAHRDLTGRPRFVTARRKNQR